MGERVVTLTKQEVEEFQRVAYGSNIQELESQIRRLTEEALKRQREFQETLTRKISKERLLNIIKGISNSDIAQKLTEVYRNRKIENVYIKDGKICFETIPLIAKTCNGNRYLVGAFKVTIKPSNCEIRFYNLDEKNVRRSYWGRYCPHPHVSETNEACLGNSAEPLTVLNQQMEYSAMASILIAFLEQANLEDCAGRYVMNWDKVDENGNVILEGAVDGNNTEFHYDLEDGSADYRDEYRTCVYDSDRYQLEEMIEVEEGVYIYEGNFSRMYYKCEECGKIEKLEKKHNNYELCDECFNAKYYICPICKEPHKLEEAVEVSYRKENTRVCQACLSKMKVDFISNSYYLATELKQIKYTRKYVLPEHVTSDTNCPVIFNQFNESYYLRADMIECENCGELVHKRDAKDYEGHKVCAECYEGLEGDIVEEVVEVVEEIAEEVMEETIEEVSTTVETPYFETAEEAEAYYNSKKGSN